MFAAIDFQGFQSNPHSVCSDGARVHTDGGFPNFIVKEISVGTLSPLSDPPYYVQRYLFKPPFPKKQLDKNALSANRYCTNYIHGLQWEDGEHEYNNLQEIITKATHGYEKVVCKGPEKARFLEKLLQREVIDLGERYLPTSINAMPLPPFAAKNFDCPHFGKCSTRQVLKILYWYRKVSNLFEGDRLCDCGTCEWCSDLEDSLSDGEALPVEDWDDIN